MFCSAHSPAGFNRGGWVLRTNRTWTAHLTTVTPVFPQCYWSFLSVDSGSIAPAFLTDDDRLLHR